MLVEIEITCPHCGETFSSRADTSEREFTTIEDCAVCCRPMQLHLVCEPGRVLELSVEAS